MRPSKVNPVVIIGSGLSGTAVAAELLRQGVPVAVVDRGPGGLREHIAAHPETLPLMDPWADPQFTPFCDGSDALHYGRWAGSRIRVGGRSLYWRGIVLPIAPSALSSWPVAVRQVLSGDGGTSPGLYSEVEEQLHAWTGAPCDWPRSSAEARLVAWMRNLGFASARPTPRAIRSQAAGRWAAYSPLLEIPTSVVKARRQLTRLSRGAAGVIHAQFAGPDSQEAYQAAAVVLCAGAVENARLVSRIVPESNVFPIVDHHAQGWISVRGSRNSTVSEPELSVLIEQDNGARTNLFLEIHRIDGDEVVDAWAMGEQLPSDATRFFFDDVGRPRFAVELTDADEAVLGSQRARLTILADAMGIRLDAWLAPPHTLSFQQALARAKSAPGSLSRMRVPSGCQITNRAHSHWRGTSSRLMASCVNSDRSSSRVRVCFHAPGPRTPPSPR
jgi:hypothetical protein